MILKYITHQHNYIQHLDLVPIHGLPLYLSSIKFNDLYLINILSRSATATVYFFKASYKHYLRMEQYYMKLWPRYYVDKSNQCSKDSNFKVPTSQVSPRSWNLFNHLDNETYPTS